MRPSIRRLILALPPAFIAAFLVTSCQDDPSGPDFRIGYLALAPSFESSAAGIVDVDSVHVVLFRDPDGEVALDTVVALATDTDSVDMSFSVMVSSSTETFALTLECLSPTGQVVFSAGPLRVTATTSTSTSVAAVTVELNYVGPGSNAASVQIVSGEPTVLFGDTVILTAEALDGSGAVIESTPIKWTSLDTVRAFVPDARVGRMVGNRERGVVSIEALLLTGPADTIEVTVEPVPSAITIVSGDGQNGIVGAALPDSIVVRVNAVDGPMSGVTVDFTTADGGSFRQASATTNAEGYAWTWWTLGSSQGLQTAMATVAGVPSLQATFTATAGAQPGGIRWAAPVDGNWSDPTKWDLGRIPTSTDTVYIIVQGDGERVFLDVPATVASLVLDGGLILNVMSGQTLTIDSSASLGGDGNLTLDDGATLTGPGPISVDGTVRWDGGATMSGTGTLTINENGWLLLSSTPARVLDGKRIDSHGNLQWSDGDIVTTNGAIIHNYGRFHSSAAAALLWDSVGTNPHLINEGVWDHTVADTTDIAIDVVFREAGSLLLFHGTLRITDALELRDTTEIRVDAVAGAPYPILVFNTARSSYVGTDASLIVGQNGTIRFEGGDLFVSGTYHQIAPGSRTEIVGGRLYVSGTVLASLVELESGILDGTFLVSDSLHWTGGRVEASMTVLDTATVVIDGPVSLQNGDIDNSGSVVWLSGAIANSGSDITTRAGGLFHIDLASDVQVDEINIYNHGTLLKTGTGNLVLTGPTEFDWFRGIIENFGTLDIREGAIAIDKYFFHYDGATLQGDGTLDFTRFELFVPGYFELSGDVLPGTSPGIIHFVDSLPQGTASVYRIEIDEPGAGTGYDQIDIAGHATFNGHLDIVTSYTPTVGETFTVITFESRTGNFSSITGLDLGDGLVFDTVWTTTSLDLEVVEATPAPAVPPQQGLVAWWPGDGNTTDIQGGRDGTFVGGASYAAGRVDQAFSFNGANEVSVPDDDLWTLEDTPFTMEMWVNLTTVQAVNPFIGHTEGAGNLNKWVFAHESGELRFHINSPTLGPVNPIATPWTPVTGQWYHIAVTRNGSAYALYIDGDEVATATNALTIPDAAADLTIGRAEAFYLVGLVDEATGYDVALDAADIQAIYAAGASGKRKDMVPLTTTNSWTNASGGLWSDPLNWALGRAPNPNDVVDVVLDGTYTVSVDEGVTVSVLHVGGAVGTQTLLVDGQTLAVGSSATFAASGVLDLSNGTIAGDGDVIIDGSMNWTSGFLNTTGTTTVGSDATVTMTTGGAKRIWYGTFNNAGSIVWDGGNLYTISDGTINNLESGTWEIQGARVFQRDNGTVVFNNAGTLIKTGAGTSVLSIPFDNATTATLDIQTDTLRFDSPSTQAGDIRVQTDATLFLNRYSHAVDTSLVGTGSFQFSAGAFVVNGTFSFPHLVAPSGFLTFNGPVTATDSMVVSGADVTFNSTLTAPPFLRFTDGTIDGSADISVVDSLIWSSGYLSTTGTTTIGSGQVLTLTSSGAKYFRNGTISNSGSIVWDGGELTSYSDATLNNLADGTMDMRGAVLFSLGGGAGVFNNAGTLTKTGAGTASVAIPLSNTGTVGVQEGTLDLNSIFTHADAALIQGTSTLDIESATYTSLSGEFDADVPGTAGTLAITGNLALDEFSDLNVDIGGTATAGVDYDVITVTGNVTIDGTINVTLIDAYSPSIEDEVTILTWTGTYADNVITPPAGWEVEVVGSTLILRYTGGP